MQLKSRVKIELVLEQKKRVSEKKLKWGPLAQKQFSRRISKEPGKLKETNTHVSSKDKENLWRSKGVVTL